MNTQEILSDLEAKTAKRISEMAQTALNDTAASTKDLQTLLAILGLAIKAQGEVKTIAPAEAPPQTLEAAEKIIAGLIEGADPE